MPNTRLTRDELEQLVNEIECFLYINCRLQELQAIFIVMAEPDNRPLKDYDVPSGDEPHSSFVPPAIQENTFELKPSLLHIVQQNQFSGNPTEDLNLHLSVFVQYADTLKSNGVDPHSIHFSFIPSSLRDRARAWL